MRIALVTAPCARMAIVALTAACMLPAAAAAAELRPCGAARCGSVTVPLVAADPAAGTVRVGFESTRIGGARSRATPSWSARGATACRRRPTGSRCGAARAAARAPRHRARRCPRHRASGRVGERRDAYGAGAAAGDLDAVRNELGAGHVELYAAGDGARIALAYAARFGDRLRALVLDGGPGATLFAGDGRAEAHGLGKALGSGEPIVARLAARLRTRPLRVHGRIDDDALARAVVRADARSLMSCTQRPPSPSRATECRCARLVGRTTALPGREEAQARVSNCHDNAPPPAAAAVDGGPFTAPTWLRALGLAACKGWPQPATPDPVVPPGAALSGAPALVLAGELGVGAPTATLRKVAGLLPSGTYVRVRGAAALPALTDPSGCAGALARGSWRSAARSAPDARAGPRARAA